MNNEIKQYLQPGKKNLIIVYVFYLCGVVAPLLPIVGVIIAYHNRNNIKNNIFISHYLFIIRTFWIWGASTIILMLIEGVSFAYMTLSVCALFWLISRAAVGLHYLIENVEHPNPLTYWVK